MADIVIKDENIRIKKSFAEQLKNLREEYNLDQQAIANWYNYGKSTVSQWENAVRLPDMAIIKNLADRFNVSLECMLGLSDEKPTCPYAFLDCVPSQSPFHIRENTNNYQIKDSFIFKVKEDSMAGTGRIHRNDLALVKKQDHFSNGNICLVSVENQISLKRCYHLTDKIELVPDNPRFPRIILDQDSVKILGVVTKVIFNTQ